VKTFLHTLSLMLGSAITAEFLLGDQYLNGMAPAGQQIAQVVLFTAFYGSAAVLIREVTRRLRGGWPVMLTLALAFGVLEEGVVTQSLFNPNYVGQHLLAYGFVPWLGTALPWLIFVLTLHVVWSIGSPIAVMEGAFGSRPWLRLGWLAVPAVLYAFAGAAIFVVSAQAGFMASWPQLGGSVALAVALVVVALTLIRRRAPQSVGARPARRVGSVISVVGGLVLSGAFQLAYGVPQSLPPWLVVLVQVAILVLGVLFGLLARPDPAAFGSGAILTYCVVGLGHAIATGPAAIGEQVVLVVIALGVLILVRLRGATAGRSDTAVASEG